ncbi:riboflavin transporter 2 [Nannochloropsis oceanica]
MESSKTSCSAGGRDQRHIHLALAAWGFSSWILFNGLWGQLPLFIRTLPEGNKLGVLILAAEQLAYIFPLLFMYKKRRFNNSRRSQEMDIWIVLLSGLAVSLLLSRYWHAQAVIDKHLHSIGLLSLAFLTGAVCSSTGVVFTPYLATLPKSYTSAHTAGAGLSGLAVALLTLAADAGSLHPRLSIERPTAAAATAAAAQENGEGGGGGGGDYGSLCDTQHHGHNDDQPLIARVVVDDDRVAAAAATGRATGESSRTKESYAAVFTLQCLLSALAYGMVPSILPLACSGYRDPSRTLMLSTVGFMCADPLGKLATSFLPTGRIFGLGLFTMAVAGWLLYCAVRSPKPPLSELPFGGWVVIVANSVFSFAFSFTSISIFFDRRRKLEKEGEEEEATKAAAAVSGAGARDGREVGEGGEKRGGEGAYEWFAWSAFMIQTGAFLGTAVSLVVVLMLS